MSCKKRGAPGKIESPLVFEDTHSGLEQILVAIESYNIAMLNLYARLSTAVQTDC